MLSDGIRQSLLCVGRRVRKFIGESAYQRLLRARTAQWLLRAAGLIQLPSPHLSAFDIAQLHYREVEAALSLAVLWVYDSSIEGDIVEFGTATGFSSQVIARAMVVAQKSLPKKRLHLFDSFEGFPEATSQVDRDSHEYRTGAWYAGLMKRLTKEQLFEACAGIIGTQSIAIHAGWFADTVPLLHAGQKFAFVHFDGDLYQSTIDAIGGLLRAGAIANGAVICFDDWNCGQADPNFGERRAWSELVADYQIQYSDWRAYSTMGRSFFIHNYRRTTISAAASTAAS
jgi:O-methyltransferase